MNDPSEKRSTCREGSKKRFSERTEKRSEKRCRATGPRSWKCTKGIPIYDVNIDFDGASKAWLANKVKLGMGEFRYKKRRGKRKT
tara:strand:- start:3300 stop:3554 length:255 start_codon:yes stop_codon:yes gene_type:complete